MLTKKSNAIAMFASTLAFIGIYVIIGGGG